MSESNSQLSARSRAPIDDTAIKWWELYGECDSTGYYVQNETDESHSEVEKEDKATSTNTLNLQRELAIDAFEKEIEQVTEAEIDESLDPTGRVLKKWREQVSRTRYEHARRALIKALKLKFEEPGRKHFKLKVRGNNIKEEFGEAKTSSNDNSTSVNVAKSTVNENQENVAPVIIIGEGNAKRDGVSQRINFCTQFRVEDNEKGLSM